MQLSIKYPYPNKNGLRNEQHFQKYGFNVFNLNKHLQADDTDWMYSFCPACWTH